MLVMKVEIVRKKVYINWLFLREKCSLLAMKVEIVGRTVYIYWLCQLYLVESGSYREFSIKETDLKNFNGCLFFML